MGKGRFLLLYGSETGQSQAIAEEIHELAPKHNLQSDIFCLSLTEKKFSLPKETCLILVISTTGEGECPENAMKFWRRLRKTTLPPDHLAHLNYAVLALGDSNYSNFCRNGKNFDERLRALGAKQFYPTGHADDAIGLEEVVEPWIEGLWNELHRILDTTSDNSPSSHDASHTACDGVAVENRLAETHIDERIDSRIDKTIGESGVNHVSRTTSVDGHARGTSDVKDELGQVGTEQSLSLANVNTASTIRTPTASGLNHSQTPNPETSDNDLQAKDSTRAVPNSSITIPLTGEGTSPSKSSEGPIVASLIHSVPPLSESGLTLPMLPPPYLKVEYAPSEMVDLKSLPVQGGASLPSSSSGIIVASIVSATKLTRDDSVKTTLDIQLKVPENSISFQPGDSFSILCPNDGAEVNDLLKRLEVSEKADEPVTVSVLEGTRKKRAGVPDFISPVTTLRHVFRTCCDIRSLPKKAFLRTLLEYTDDPREKRRLQELCSKQGQPDYAAFLRGPGLSLLDVLHAFPSCHPPIDRILEHAPRLLPRPYSISSSPLASSSSFHFVFNIINIPPGDGRSQARKGVCTGWLSHLTTSSGRSQTDNRPIIDNLEEKVDKLSLECPAEIPIYARINQHFHLPVDTSKPLVLIGPGTGVAPFIGFLDHRCHLLKTATNQDSGEEVTFGPVWLFSGCRHRDRDFLYREKLEEFLETGILSRLCMSFSRDPATGEENSGPAPRYVQDNVRLHKDELAALVLDQDACVYVCGDAKNMARNVLDAWKDILGEKTGRGDYEMLQLIAKLRAEKRYLEDVWT